MCRKVPAEIPIKKIDTLYDKIKLLAIPESEMGQEPTPTKAVIRLTVGKQKRPAPEEGQEPVKGPKMIEID